MSNKLTAKIDKPRASHALTELGFIEGESGLVLDEKSKVVKPDSVWELKKWCLKQRSEHYFSSELNCR